MDAYARGGYGCADPHAPLPLFPIPNPRRTEWTVRRPRTSNVFSSPVRILRSLPPIPSAPHHTPRPTQPSWHGGTRPQPITPHTFSLSASAICFKMLRELNSSDTLRLKHIVSKIRDMAHRAPNLVLETIYDYFIDNLEVGAARAIQGRHGEQTGAGSQASSNLGFSTQQRHDLSQSNSLSGQWAEGGGGRNVGQCVVTNLGKVS